MICLDVSLGCVCLYKHLCKYLSAYISTYIDEICVDAGLGHKRWKAYDPPIIPAIPAISALQSLQSLQYRLR